MKEKHLSLSATFGPVALYREDLEEIITIISRASDGIKLYDATYKYDSFDELVAEHPDKINIFAIKCTEEPFVSLRLTDQSLAVELSAPNRESAEAAFFKLKDLLASKVRLLPKIIVGIVMCLFIANLVSAISLVLLVFTDSSHWLAYIPRGSFPVFGVIAGTILVAGPALIKYAYSGKMNYISTKYRKERSGFYKRNKELIEKIIAAAIAAIIGGIIGAWLKK